MTLRIVAPHFVAGAIVKDETVVEAAPIIHKSLIGTTVDYVKRWCAYRQYRLEFPRLYNG